MQLQRWDPARVASRCRLCPDERNTCEQAGGEAWAGATGVAIVAGSARADLTYLKSASLQLWLFGYELPGACMSHWLVDLLQSA